MDFSGCPPVQYSNLFTSLHLPFCQTDLCLSWVRFYALLSPVSTVGRQTNQSTSWTSNQRYQILGGKTETAWDRSVLSQHYAAHGPANGIFFSWFLAWSPWPRLFCPGNGSCLQFRNNQALQLKFLRMTGSLNLGVCNGFLVSVHLDARLSAAAGSDSLFPGGRPRVLFRGESFPCAGKIASVKILKRQLLILISLPPPHTQRTNLYILKICQVNSISYKVTVNSDLRAPQKLLLCRYIEKLPTFADQAEE